MKCAKWQVTCLEIAQEYDLAGPLILQLPSAVSTQKELHAFVTTIDIPSESGSKSENKVFKLSCFAFKPLDWHGLQNLNISAEFGKQSRVRYKHCLLSSLSPPTNNNIALDQTFVSTLMDYFECNAAL
jgi:hypothetical protein